MGVSIADGVVAVAPKIIIAGTNITTSEIDNTITINASGGGFTLPTTTVTSVSDTSTSTLLLVESGTAKQITIDDLVAAISTPASGLAVAAALSDSNIITISQDGGATEVRTTLAALKAYIGAVVTVPGAPTGVTATAGNASASVAFTAPASNGGSAITGYTVTSSPGGFTGTGSASPISVSGLSNATAYTFTVTATNAIGTGSASSASSAVTPSAGATAPAQVTGLTLGTATSTTQPLTWTAPSNGGSAITDYVVQWAVAGSGTWNTFADGTSTTASATVTGLTASTSYDYRVAAVNAIGTGTNSATATGSTAAAGTSYTITPYGGATFRTTQNATSLPNVGGYKYAVGATDGPVQGGSGSYITVSPATSDNKCEFGWGTSSTVPPSSTAANGTYGNNGLVSCNHNGIAYPTGGIYLWLTPGAGTQTWYFWAKATGATAQLLSTAVISNI